MMRMASEAEVAAFRASGGAARVEALLAGLEYAEEEDAGPLQGGVVVLEPPADAADLDGAILQAAEGRAAELRVSGRAPAGRVVRVVVQAGRRRIRVDVNQ